MDLFYNDISKRLAEGKEAVSRAEQLAAKADILENQAAQYRNKYTHDMGKLLGVMQDNVDLRRDKYQLENAERRLKDEVERLSGEAAATKKELDVIKAPATTGRILDVLDRADLLVKEFAAITAVSYGRLGQMLDDARAALSAVPKEWWDEVRENRKRRE